MKGISFEKGTYIPISSKGESSPSYTLSGVSVGPAKFAVSRFAT